MKFTIHIQEGDGTDWRDITNHNIGNKCILSEIQDFLKDKGYKNATVKFNGWDEKPTDWIDECTKIGKMYKKEAEQQWKQKNPCVKYINTKCPKNRKKRNHPKCKTCGVNIIL